MQWVRSEDGSFPLFHSSFQWDGIPSNLFFNDVSRKGIDTVESY